MLGVSSKIEKDFRKIFKLDINDCFDYHVKMFTGLDIFSIERFENLVKIDLEYFFMKEVSLKEKIRHTYGANGVKLINEIINNRRN